MFFRTVLGQSQEPVVVTVTNVFIDSLDLTACSDDVRYTVKRLDGTVYPTTPTDDDMIFDMVIMSTTH